MASLAALGWTGRERAALAVSGGGDSLALMHLFAWRGREGNAVPPTVLVVDHGLRARSARDAAKACQWAKHAGFESHMLTWRGNKPHSDVEAAAREARFRLIGEWCRAHAVKTVFLAHTEDDQAETFLLRLARGSGVDGLAAMFPRAAFPLAGYDIDVLRPLLEMTRRELREYLVERDQPWLDDPMNVNPRFARARLRSVMPILETAGLTPTRIAKAAAHIARARDALDNMTSSVMGDAVIFDQAGYALLDGEKLACAPREIGLRVLSTALVSVSGETYRPRFDRIDSLFNAMTRRLPAARTLHGCRIGLAPKPWRKFGARTLMLTRESRAAMRAPDVLLTVGRETIWDNRFRFTLEERLPSRALHVRALGERPDLAQALAHVPAPARAALPAIWSRGAVVALPHAKERADGNFKLSIEFLGLRRAPWSRHR